MEIANAHTLIQFYLSFSLIALHEILARNFKEAQTRSNSRGPTHGINTTQRELHIGSGILYFF